MNNEEDITPSTGPQGPYQPIVPESNDDNTPIAGSTADDPDDALLQSASSDMGEEVGVPPPAEFKSSGGKGKKILLLLFLLALIAGGAAAYYFLVYKKPAPTPTTEAPIETPAANTFTPDSVTYAFREKEKDPFMLYLRPVAGGDRLEAGQLGKDAYPQQSDVYGQNIAVVFDNKLRVSTDGGKTYTQILDPEAGQEITSAGFNTDGTKLAVAIVEGNKNTVSSIDLDGQNMAEIFTSKDHAGIDIMGWNDRSMVYDAGCWGCDGSPPNPYVYDLESKKPKQLIKDIPDGAQIWKAAVSEDLSKLVYSSGKTNPNPDGLGATPLAPHTITLLDVESGESTTIGTVGKANEKANNGTALWRDTLVGFMANSTNPYYTDESKLLTVDGTEPTVLYEADKTIVTVLFVNEKSVIASSGTNDDFVLANFTIANEESTTILEGDAQTVLFGVTTK